LVSRADAMTGNPTMSQDARNLTLRTLDVLEALCGFAATGATNGELAAAARTSAPNITRAMAQLVAKGWATKDAYSGRFYPSPNFTRLTYRINEDFRRAQTRLDDRRLNVTGGVRRTFS